MADELGRLAQIQQAHHTRLVALQETTADLVGQTFDVYGGLNDAALAEFSSAAAVVIDTAKMQTATLATGYMNANDRLGGFGPSGLVSAMPEIRNGIPTQDVYARSIVEARRQVAAGASYDQALAAGRARATATARTDVSLSNRSAMNAGADLRPWVVGYRRVLTGRSCAFCATASTQRYHSADLLPLHPSCDCDIAEIFGTDDPGHVINSDMLSELKQAGAADGRPDYWNGPYIVEKDGAIHYRKLETVLGPDGVPLRAADGSLVKRVETGARVKVETVNHGELGPTLTDASHDATKVADLPPADRPVVVNTPPPPPVVAEPVAPPAPPAPVVAEPAPLARRAKLTAADPDIVAAAERFGVSPDEVLTARTRVTELRSVVREEAARTQAEAMAELDRLDIDKLKPPARKTAKSGGGRNLRGGEYDFLEQLDDREKARLSRSWYGGSQAPDQFAVNMRTALGRDVSSDEAMDIWLEQNRRAEASGALRRGKLPSMDAYSGQIDVGSLVPGLSGEGYDVSILLGDDLTAAGHTAAVERQVMQREAMSYLGDAATATEGPAPYRMGFQSWEAEVRDLEFELERGQMSAAAARRYAELVPQYIDEPGLDFEELYARIVSTARKAGEEVPDYARIPW